MRLVHQKQRTMTPADLKQLPNRRQRAVGAEHRVGDDDGALLVARSQRGVHGVDVAVRRHHNPRPRQPTGIHQRRMRTGVGHQQGTRAGQADHGAQVGRVARGEQQSRGSADELGELGLELLVQLGVAGNQARPGGAGAPDPQRLDAAVDDGGMSGQTEIVVGGQVQLGGDRGTRPQAAPQSGLMALPLHRVQPGQR
ncbi:Uncharacterised protein [Mycobacterium tuberculosis]|nr:Uncharacterised protein [Mycobacterium tuberculosis]